MKYVTKKAKDGKTKLYYKQYANGIEKRISKALYDKETKKK